MSYPTRQTEFRKGNCSGSSSGFTGWNLTGERIVSGFTDNAYVNGMKQRKIRIGE